MTAAASGTIGLERELVQLALHLEDYDPPAAFSLRQEAGFFSEIPFKLGLHPKSGRVRVVEALKLYHGIPKGRFLLASAATPAPSVRNMRRTSLERTLRACLHGLDWRGAELQVRCDLRSLTPELRAQLRRELVTLLDKHPSDDLTEFVIPWRRLAAEPPVEQAGPAQRSTQAEAVLAAARKLSVTSPVDLYEQALLSIFPTVCASRGLRMEDCLSLVRGRGSWAFRVAESIHRSFGSPVSVELAGRRYRPAASRSPTPHIHRGPHQQGRWETDDRDASTHPEIVVLLGGGDPVTVDNAPEIRSSLLFHIHRDSLTPEAEQILREKGVVVVPHLLLCSVEELAADSLARPSLVEQALRSDPTGIAALSQELRASWRQCLLGVWERVISRAREEQCSAHQACLRLAASDLVQFVRSRLKLPPLPTATEPRSSQSSPPPAPAEN